MATRHRTTALLLLAALALATAGCAAGDPDAAPESAGVDLDFAATTLDGDAFDGNQLAGRPALLWFWAPWCPTCHAQTPTVNDLADTYHKQVNVVAVGGLDDASAIRGYADQLSDHLTLLIDAEGAVWQHFGVTSQSTYVILDADGQVVADGYLDDTEATERVADLAG